MRNLTFTAFIGLLVFSMVFVSCQHLKKVKSEETDTQNTGEVSQDDTPKQLPPGGGVEEPYTSPGEPPEQLPPGPPSAGNAAVTVPATRPKDEWDPILRDKNIAYLHEKLGTEEMDEWFTTIPQEPEFFYFIAVSNKTTTDQRARTRAQEEARRLLREYYEVINGAAPGPTVGRGIEVVEWKIIRDTSSEGRQNYIACTLVRVPVQGVIE